MMGGTRTGAATTPWRPISEQGQLRRSFHQPSDCLQNRRLSPRPIWSAGSNSNSLVPTTIVANTPIWTQAAILNGTRAEHRLGGLSNV